MMLTREEYAALRARGAFDVLEVQYFMLTTQLAASENAAYDVAGTIQVLKQKLAEAQARYNDLIMQVGKKFDGESRHGTAKRYIQQHEHCGEGGPTQHRYPASELTDNFGKPLP